MPTKVDPPVLIARPQAQNNKKVLAARLRYIATLVLNGKRKAAWHSLIALADKKVFEDRLRQIAALVLRGKKKEPWHTLTALADKIDPDTK